MSGVMKLASSVYCRRRKEEDGRVYLTRPFLDVISASPTRDLCLLIKSTVSSFVTTVLLGEGGNEG